ncbi:connectin-like [Zerene cesonia]|uniref:connectin-like n=1 Tax=Zerene cesonia TaxID=33412 RepID=UPI0018E522FA|nr:connectin-like [Zerene cesonia]XP_038212678.1 connectin-like [Zerene cesonia]XP_038212679.1 connectin-like [Zerene cesonia]
MRAQKIPAALLLLLIAIDSLHANRRKQKEKIVQTAINICDISDRDSKVHCYCENSQDINEAIKTECWVFNGGIDRADPLWSSFTSQMNIETLAFNVRADGGLSFVPTRVLRYLRKLTQFSIKYSSIPKIESYTFVNVTSVREMTLTKNQIVVLSKHAFFNLPNLTVLTLDENKIKKIETETFYELPALQKLFLTSNNISVIEDGAFRHLVNLLELEIDKNNISELKKECFDGLANLKRLDLRKNKIAILNSFTFIELWNLQELLLDYNEIYILAQRTFDGLSQLKKLSLSHNRLVTLVDGLFEGVRGLSALDLRHNKLKRFTFENLRPIYDNLKLQKSYIFLEGNDFDCDCHLAWMHKLRHETKSSKVRTSFENFVCKFNSDLSPNSHFTYYERIDTKNNIDSDKIRDDADNTDEFHDEIDESYLDEPKRVRGDNERTLLQIPVELLPCPAEVKSVTDRTYTYPSQNEAKDYRNLITTSSISPVGINISVFLLSLLLLLG